MGQSPTATIIYGVSFEEGHEFPWTDLDDEIDEWWLLTCEDYTDKEYPFDDAGNWKDGWTEDDPRVNEYYKHKRDYLKFNPVPFEVCYVGGYDSTQFVLGVLNTSISADWDPLELNKHEAEDTNIDLFNDAMKKYSITNDEPRWLLVPFYG